MEQLDVEFLQKLAYDRSRVWSSFFDRYQSVDMLKDVENDVDITNLEKTYSSGKNDDLVDDLAYMEDDCDDEVDTEFLKNATNTTQFSLMIGNNAMDLSVVSKTQKEQQYIDVINKTLPILNEHNRQLKEFGFDKVLYTFNKDEIENKFGSWLNRHNSLFGGDNTLIHDAKNNSQEKRVAAYPAKSEVMDYDSDASLQSGETARYIRSSRVGTTRNTTTTMIKTYRMVRKTNENHARETEDYDYQNAARIRKKLENAECQKHFGMTPLTRSRRIEGITFTNRTQRRKVLRKRLHSKCCNLNYSSSDSDCFENDVKCQRQSLKYRCCKPKHCSSAIYSTPLTAASRSRTILKSRSAMQMSSAFRNRIYYFARTMSTPSSSSSSPSCSRFMERRRDIKRNTKLSSDDSLYKPESQYRCSTKKKMLKKIKHVMDTSTEERHVDSEYTPKKQPPSPMTTTETKKSQQPKPSQVEKLPPISEKKQKVKTESKLKKNNYKPKNKQLVEPDVIGEDDSTDTELKKAIKASKLCYEKELKKRLQQSSAKKDEIKPNKKSSKKSIKTEVDNFSEKAAIKTKKLAEKTESAKKKSYAPKDLSRTLKVNSFFAPTQTKAICNSTALSSDSQAYKRQFADTQEQIIEEDVNDTKSLEDEPVTAITQSNSKSTSSKLNNTRMPKENGTSNFAVSSTTLRSPDLSPSLSETLISTPQTAKKAGNKAQSDCADVTSTTNAETTVLKATGKKSSNDLTENGFLIYAPENRHTLPANSLVGGCFTVTQEHLSGVIGETAAKNFLKYYTGRTRFRLDSKVYYEPPHNSSLHQSSTSSDDLDFFDQFGKLIVVNK